MSDGQSGCCLVWLQVAVKALHCLEVTKAHDMTCCKQVLSIFNFNLQVSNDSPKSDCQKSEKAQVGGSVGSR